MKRILAALVGTLAFGSFVFAQERPANWNRLSADQQRIWTANCNPPSAQMAGMCEALSSLGTRAQTPKAGTPAPVNPTLVGPRGSVVVCKDGQRFPLPAFDTNGLSSSEIEQININNGNNRCRTAHDGVLKILSADATAALASSETAAQSTTAAADQTPSPAGKACAENGSCYGDISAATGKPKTVEVKGYTRKDGTVVKGHYRSK